MKRLAFVFLLFAGALSANPLIFLSARPPAVASQPYFDAVLADSPYAYWRLSEAAPSGTGALLDSSGNGRHIDAPGSGITWNQAGMLAENSGKSAMLDGTVALTGGATHASAVLGSANWTVEMWVYPRPFDVTTAAGYLFGAAADSTHRVGIQHFNNGLFTSSTVGGNKSSPSSVMPRAPNHVVLTSAGDLYLNGVAQSGTSSAPLNSTNQLLIGALNNGSSYFTGRVGEVALYTTVLNSTRVAAHYSAAITWSPGNVRTFYWDMETQEANVFPPGTDSVAQLDSGATLSSAQAYAESQSISLGGGTFRSATFDNPTNQPKWASPTRGTIRGWFRWNGTFGASDAMITQITGKDRSLVDNTEDGVSIVFDGANAVMTYKYAGGASSVNLTTTVTIAADTWHEFEGKWDTEGTTTMSLRIDSTTNTTTTAIGAVNCTTFHHLIVGNDRNVNLTGLWLDEFEVFNYWVL